MAYGWWAVLGVFLQLFIHEAGTVLVAYEKKLPLRFRFFPFGAHATIILEDQPRQIWRDAMVGLGGPVIGAAFSLTLMGIYLSLGMRTRSCMRAIPFFSPSLVWVTLQSPDAGSHSGS